MQNKKKLDKLTAAVKNVLHKSFRPFKQQPPVNMKDPANASKEELSGNDLFVHFTADVIKREIIFER